MAVIPSCAARALSFLTLLALVYSSRGTEIVVEVAEGSLAGTLLELGQSGNIARFYVRISSILRWIHFDQFSGRVHPV